MQRLFTHTIPALNDPAQLAGEGDDADTKNLFISATGTTNARRERHDATGRHPQAHGLALFRIPRPWEMQRPKFTTDDIDELVDFFEQVDTIIELGGISDEQERKQLLTSYLPVNKRILWRSLDTYQRSCSLKEFVTEIRRMYPELADRESGTIAELEELCRNHDGLDGTNEGRLRRFGWAFGTLVRKLQRAPAVMTNRDACRRYLEALDSAFAKRVRAAVLERAAGRIALEMAGLKLQHVAERRREDPISLEDLMNIAETVSRQSWTYQHATTSPASLTSVSAWNTSGEKMPQPSSNATQQRGSGYTSSSIELGLHETPKPKTREPKPAVVSVFAGDSGAAGGVLPAHGEGDGGNQYNMFLRAGFMHHGPETSSREPEQRGLHAEIENLRRIIEDLREELDWTTNHTVLIRTELETSKFEQRDASVARGPAPMRGLAPIAEDGGQQTESGTVYNEIRRIWGALGRLEEETAARTKNLHMFNQDIGRLEDMHSRLEGGVDELRHQAFGEIGVVRNELEVVGRRLGAAGDITGGTTGMLRESVDEMSEAVADIRREMYSAIQDLRDELFATEARGLDNNAPGHRFSNSSDAILLQNWLRLERGSEALPDRRKPNTFAPLLTKKQRLALERAKTEKMAGAPRKPKRGKRGRSKRVLKDAGLANQSCSDAFEMAQDPRRAPNTESRVDVLDDEIAAEVNEEQPESRQVEEECRLVRFGPLLDPTRLAANGLGVDSDAEDFAEIEVLFDAGLDVDEI
uniref:Uncharacterized protein n=1 Tax=Mycena chlorophos TaxID=658473 RepID=A0ABQ0L6L4_MYCCL|nr:predicted protein [Mycena chlorophos]